MLDQLGAEFAKAESRVSAADVAPAAGRRKVLLLVPAAVLLLAVVAALMLLGPSGTGSVGPTTAQAALNELADKVDSQGEALLLEGHQVLYQREFGSGGQINDEPAGIYIAPGTYIERIAEQWTDRKSRRWYTVDEGHGAYSNLRMTPAQDSFAFLDGRLTYQETISLPRDPDELYARLSAAKKDPRRQISTLQTLLDHPLPTDLQGALIKAAAEIPGVRLVGDVVTPFGDVVTAVSYPVGRGVKWELLFDPESGSYRGRTIVLPDGARLYESLILERAVVSAPGDLPAGKQVHLPPGEQAREKEATLGAPAE